MTRELEDRIEQLERRIVELEGQMAQVAPILGDIMRDPSAMMSLVFTQAMRDRATVDPGTTSDQ